MSTDRPSAAIAAGRYVIHWHYPKADERSVMPRGEHYDWMFEVQGRLLTWASEQLPSRDHAGTVAATLLAPHRLIYLDYEGPVSGDRGTVRRIETGNHRLLTVTADRYEFLVRGQRCGALSIYRTRSEAEAESWTIEFEPNRDDRPVRAEANW